MANDLNRDSVQLALNPQHLQQVVSAQAALRGLTEAMVFDRAGHMLARSSLSFTLGFEPLPDDAMHLADSGDVAIMTNDSDDRVRALVRLNQFGDVYLYVGRFIEPRVLNHMEETQRAAALYEQMEGQRSGFQITFALIFMMVAMLFLVAAVAIGIHFAAQFAGPISRLITAAEQVRGGDLAARVPEGEKDDELASLSRAFNRMTYQIESQQRELREANRQLDERRRFTETVLTGVSAGVIGLDSLGRVNLPNRSASALLGTDLEQAIGQDLAEVAPEMAGLLDEAERRPDRLAQSQVELIRGNSTRTLLVRIAAEHNDRVMSGFVVTFDDITELLSAQRKAAWADIARRIAHEIKNPLTPIQLAAERLRRRYLKEIKSDVETFTICTDTIVRHVGDIGRMIDEFSSFARMPTPVLKPENLVEIVHRAVFLQRTAHPEIVFEPVFPAKPGDGQLRCALGWSGADQYRQERNRIDRGAQGRGQFEPGRMHPGVGCGGGWPGRSDYRRQREGVAAAWARAADRALYHDADKGHRLGSGHRQEDHGRSSRRAGPGGWGDGGRPHQSPFCRLGDSRCATSRCSR